MVFSESFSFGSSSYQKKVLRISHFPIALVLFHTNGWISVLPAVCLKLTCSMPKVFKVNLQGLVVTQSLQKSFAMKKLQFLKILKLAQLGLKTSVVWGVNPPFKFLFIATGHISTQKGLLRGLGGKVSVCRTCVFFSPDSGS